MIRISGRARLLIGALGLAAGAWVVDVATRGGPPAAQAAGGAGTPRKTVSPRGWADIATLAARLAGNDYRSVAPDVATLPRDLFTPSGPLAVSMMPPTEAPDQAAESAVVEPEPVAPAPSFAERHRLVGVVVGGRKPVAIVDEKVCTLGSELDGYTLVKIEREEVVWKEAATGDVVTLKLERPATDAP